MINDLQTGSSIWRRVFLDRTVPSLIVILFVTLTMGLIFWVADAALDSFVLNEGELLQQVLLNPSREEVFIRGLALLCFLALGGGIAFVVLKLQATWKELQNKKTYLKTALHSLGEAVIATDASGRIQSMNERSESLTGWDLDEVQGLPLENVFRIFNAVTREPVADPVRRVLEEGAIQSSTNSTVLRARDGTEYRIADSASPIRDEQARVTGVVIVFRDVTESCQLREALEESKQRYRSLYENIRDAILLADTERRIFDCNPAFESLFGYSLEEIKGKRTLSIYENEEEFQRLGNAVNEHINNSSFLMTVHYKKKNGEVFSGETGVYYLKDRTGEVVGLIGVIRDITARIQAEKAIENERAYLSAVIDNIGEAIVICDAEGRIVRFNETARRLHGLPEQPIPSDQWAEHFDLYQEDGITPLPMEDIPLFRALQGERVRGAEIVVAPKHNRPFYLVCSGQALTDETGKITGAVVAMHDITEYKQKEESLRQSESYYRTLFETAGTSMLILEEDTTIAHANSNFEELSGYFRQELEGKKYGTDFVHPDDVEWMKEYHYQRLHDPGAVPSNLEFRFITRNGELRHGYLCIGMIPNTTQSILSLLDITTIKEAEVRLQSAYNKLDTLVQLNAEGLMVLDREGKILFTNPATEKMLRREQEELLGEEFGYLLTPNASTEIELLSEAGGTSVVELRTRETEWSGQSALLATFRDITERKRAEEELEAIYENAPLIMLLLDSDQLVRKANRYSTDFIGVSEESMYGQRVGDLLRCTHHLDSPGGCGSGPQCEQCTLLNIVSETLRTGQSFNQVETTATLVRNDEEWDFTFLISSTPLQHQGEPMVLFALMDITLRKEAEESLRRLSFSDTLTGLYNRNFFEEEMNRLSDGRHSPIGIIIFDVDGLKSINDTLGHENGDHILVSIAGILKENLRNSDIIARIGGDEFAVLLPRIDQAGMQGIVERVRDSVEQFNTTQGQIPLSVSMGQAVSELGKTDMPALLKEADNRMYGEKMQRRESSQRERP